MAAPPHSGDAETRVASEDRPPPGGPGPGSGGWGPGGWGPGRREPGPSRGLGWGMLLGALVLVAVAGAIAAVYFATRDGDSSVAATSVAGTTTAAASTGVLPPAQAFVPDITGLTRDEAASRLGAAHLVPVIEFKPTKKPSGRVVAQKPKAGKRAKRGANVTVVVDRGAPTVSVPDVTELAVADARAKLTDAGLETQTTQVTAADKPAGTVVSQAPAAGEKRDRGAAVTLSVTRRPAGVTTTEATATTGQPTTTKQTTVSVPDLSGAALQSATQTLIDANLLATLAYVPGEHPLGTIVAQQPAADASTKPRAHVTLNLSAGPGQKEQETVPDTTGQSLKQAVSTLNAVGLRLIFEKLPVTTRAQVGAVVEQSPAAGKTAPKNAQVLVYVGVVDG